jgi:cobalt-zinc-cadmium efflux system outer membrane protein
MSHQTHISAGLLALGMACLTGPALRGQQIAAPMPHLSRQQAIKEAIAHNPSITAAREQVAEARAGIAIATALPDPSLVAEVDQEKNFFNPRSGSERDVGVQFTVPYPYRTRLNGRIARGGWQAAQYALTQLQQQIASQTAQAYDAVQAAVRHRDDLIQSREISVQFVEKANTRFLAGTVPKLDTIKAKVELARAENALIANERMIANSKSALNHLLGRAMGVTLEEIDALDIPGAVPDLNSLEQLAMASRPELQSMRVQRRAAHDSTTLAKQYWAPDLNLTLWKSQIDGAPDSYKFDGGITFPLFFWQHEKGQVAQAEHHEKELDATERELFSQVMLDVRNSHTTASIAWRQAVFLRDQLLPEAHFEFDTTFTSYSAGGSSALDLLNAKSTLLDAESQYTDALGAANDATADLERAVGAPLTNVISTSPSSHDK